MNQMLIKLHLENLKANATALIMEVENVDTFKLNPKKYNVIITDIHNQEKDDT